MEKAELPQSFDVVAVSARGVTYRGTQLVTGELKRYQSVVFYGRVKNDSHAYAPHETAEMNLAAQQLLLALAGDASGRGLAGKFRIES